MKAVLLLGAIAVSVLFYMTKSEPGFNGTTPGCGGSGCHTSTTGIVTAQVLTNNQVRITISGTTSSVAGELVDANNIVVAVKNPTSSNPFTLTAPSSGTYTVNAGYKNPSRKYGTTTVEISVTGIEDKKIGTNPNYFELYSNYPNPFNPETRIRFAIPQAELVTLKIYNIAGEEVASLINEQRAAGIYEVNFRALNLPSGTYLYKIDAGSFSETKKMVLLK